MTTQTSKRKPRAHRAPRPSAPRMAQPEEMKTKSYGYGVEKLNGYDAWALFEACAAGDVPKVKTLLAKDRRLVNAQFWYQFPIHLAVFAGNAEIVKLLLDQGADPGQSRFTYNSWDKLLQVARERGHRQVESLLHRAMQKRFNYTPEFDVLKESIIARDAPLAAAVRSCFDGEDRKQAERGRRMIEFLLKRGAATNLPGDEPWATPLAWARKRRLRDIEETLKQHGAT